MIIDPRIKRDLGPALSARFPHLQRGDVRMDGNDLVFNVPVDMAVVAGLVAELQAGIEAAKRPIVNSFRWMQGRQAKEWQRALRK